MLAGCTLASIAAAGCAPDDGMSRTTRPTYTVPARVYEINPRQFTMQVLRSEQPILVNFYKPG
jgi:hypothetical protein